MARIAVTDGLSDEAKTLLEKQGHEVIVQFYEKSDLESGVLNDFDAWAIRKIALNILMMNTNTILQILDLVVAAQHVLPFRIEQKYYKGNGGFAKFFDQVWTSKLASLRSDA